MSEIVDVERRVLDAAEVLFAEKGYDGTSIRDITTRADCNVASINYYYGSKKKLYESVLLRYLRYLKDVRLEAIQEVVSKDYTLEELLERFSIAFLGSLSGVAGNASAVKLLMRESLDPVIGGVAAIISNFVEVKQNMFQAILKLYPKADEKKVMVCLIAVVGHLWQMSHFLDENSVMMKGLMGGLDNEYVMSNSRRFMIGGVHAILEEGER